MTASPPPSLPSPQQHQRCQQRATTTTTSPTTTRIWAAGADGRMLARHGEGRQIDGLRAEDPTIHTVAHPTTWPQPQMWMMTTTSCLKTPRPPSLALSSHAAHIAATPRRDPKPSSSLHPKFLSMTSLPTGLNNDYNNVEGWGRILGDLKHRRWQLAKHQGTHLDNNNINWVQPSNLSNHGWW